MKLGPVTKFDKKKKITPKKFDVDVMLKNCDVIIIFRIFGKFGAIRRSDSGHRVKVLFWTKNTNFCKK